MIPFTFVYFDIASSGTTERAVHQSTAPKRQKTSSSSSSSAVVLSIMDSIQTSQTRDGQPYFAGRHCNPCPVCICPCWPRWNLISIGGDDKQCDCWLGTCFCGNLFEASLCVITSKENLGYPHELYRDSTCCSVVSSLTHPEYNDEEFAASHCFCCREDDEDDACYCHPYTNYKGKEQLAYCSFFSYESPEYKQYRADWQEWWKSQGRNAGARRPMRMIR